ncbi:MAG: hypothetical protein RLN69_11290 [Woeseiaceae bacterium]
MIDKQTIRLATILLCSALAMACQESDTASDAAGAAQNPVATSNKPNASIQDDAVVRSPGKPTAPVSIRYDVVGNAVVGQPVAINLQVSSSVPDQAVTLHYRTNDNSAMLFPESQAMRIEMNAAPDDSPRMQQVSVIPQREGRLFLNVSAEVQTANGMMFRSVAIPIQVGAGSREPAVNGELRETAEGEQVISMPASESGGS